MPVYKDKRKTKDNRQYYYSIHYVDSYGKAHRIQSKRFATKKEAEKEEAKQLLELDKIASETMTFNQALDLFLEEKKKLVKYSTYYYFVKTTRHIRNVLGDVRIDKLTIKQYQEFLDYLDNYERDGKPISNKFKNKVIEALKATLDFTDKRYDLTSSIPNKFNNFKNEDKKEMKFITLKEFNHLLNYVDSDIYKTLFIVLFYMGLRIGEANALQWINVDFNKNTLEIKKTLSTKLRNEEGDPVITTPKTKSSIRTLPMPQIVSKALLDLHDYYSRYDSFNDGWYVFGGYKPIGESTIRLYKDVCFENARLEPIRLHDFRHSCASYLINNGASPLLVSKWLGHSDITMTLNTYSHLYKSELEDVVNKINAENCW